jgi:hypothetical protein
MVHVIGGDWNVDIGENNSRRQKQEQPITTSMVRNYEQKHILMH